MIVDELQGITHCREEFFRRHDFLGLLDAHGNEVRGRPLVLQLSRYEQMNSEGRLGLYVARHFDGALKNEVVGYSLHWWYWSLHDAGTKVGHDDLWYVLPAWRGKRLGRMLKMMGIDWLKRQGCVRTEDFIRYRPGEPNRVLKNLGYVDIGRQWIKEL